MTNRTLRIFVVLAVVMLLAVITVQFMGLKQAYSLEDQDFDRRVTNALRVVTQRMLSFNRNPNNLQIKPVERVSSNYYTVQINDVINPQILEAFVKQEFARHDVRLNFEYGIYDCVKNRIQYGGFVCVSATCDSTSSVKYQFPQLPGYNYYFGIYFPDARFYLLDQLSSWLVSSGVLLLISGLFAYAVWVIFRQKRLSEIQTDFINNMTHEFKTPISTISISSEVLARPDIVQSPERLLSYATIIRNEANRLRKHVDAVLQIAKLSDSGQELHWETLDLHEVLEELTNSTLPVLKDKQANVTLELNAERSVMKADRLHLSNILHNLLDNSLKYCEQVPQIKISTHNEGDYLFVKIQDNGLGISEKDQKLVFTKFYRVPTGNVHNVKGFGLGLYYVKMMVEAHRGKISLSSKLGEGSTFTLKFRVEA
jgi:two-component system, OmpR family, phosphate regulon sensor histidine kinase PhoR